MSRATRPPRLAKLLITTALHPDDRECALSDLAEEFEHRASRDGVAAARRWYRGQVGRSIWPSIWRRKPTASAWALIKVVPSEFHWVWRGLKTRGWRAVVIVLLFGVALAANAVVFAAADAFAFRTVPYWQSDRLVIVEQVGLYSSDYQRPQAIRGWRAHTDLFSSVQAHIAGGTAYLTANGETTAIAGHRITPGMFEMLGVLPRWGRPFTMSDLESALGRVILGESLARRVFGDPSAAVGGLFSTGSETLTVVGVMPASFRFPTAREEFWRPLDLAAWPNDRGLGNVARLADGLTMASAEEMFALRAPAVEQLLDRRVRNQQMRLRPMAALRVNGGARSVFLVLMGAAGCLLLIACANVASLEVAGVSRRIRDQAIQAALGASRGSLIRAMLTEGAVLVLASVAVASTLTAWGLTLLDDQLTVAMQDALTNPLDIDVRAMSFMAAAAFAMWMLTSVPAIRRLSRLAIVDGLRDDPRTMPVTRAAARSRNVLMAGQVALTTLLLAGALLYIRTYAAKVGLDKGFDDTNIATIVVSPAPDAPLKGGDLESRVLDRLRATDGVRLVSRTGSLPPSVQSGGISRLEILGRDPTQERVMLHGANVDPEFFATMNIVIVSGRAFEAGSPRDEVVIDERFARTYWPGGDAIGSRFQLRNVGLSGVTDFHVVGISRQLRADRLVTEAGEQVYVMYIRISPTSHPMTFVARLDDPRVMARLDDAIRSVAERVTIRVDSVAARYARLEANVRLVAVLTTGFSVVALLVAVTGIYAVMAYLVAGRSREIAIRMALGSDRAGVRRLVLSNSLRFVVGGLAVGSLAAFAAASWLRAELFGVTPHDPMTYVSVGAIIVGTALFASWWPARHASRIDPAAALKQ